MRGNSAHCAPVGKIHNIPSSISLSLQRGRPRFVGFGFGSRIDCDLAHCSSLKRIPLCCQYSPRHTVTYFPDGLGVSWAWWKLAPGFGMYDLAKNAWDVGVVNALLPNTPVR